MTGEAPCEEGAGGKVGRCTISLWGQREVMGQQGCSIQKQGHQVRAANVLRVGKKGVWGGHRSLLMSVSTCIFNGSLRIHHKEGALTLIHNGIKFSAQGVYVYGRSNSIQTAVKPEYIQDHKTCGTVGYKGRAGGGREPKRTVIHSRNIYGVPDTCQTIKGRY